MEFEPAAQTPSFKPAASWGGGLDGGLPPVTGWFIRKQMSSQEYYRDGL